MNTTLYFGPMVLAPPFDVTPGNIIAGIMAMFLPLAIFVVVVGLLVISIYYNHRKEKQRTADLQRLAEELGFEFLPAGDSSFLANLSGFHLFSQGHAKRLFNLMRGRTQKLDVSIFDYNYVTGSGKNRHTWHQTVVCFQVDAAYLPTFSLRPENVWYKIGAWFGYQDINFAGRPVFSKNYLLRGREEEAIRNLFTDEVLAFYETNLKLSTEGDKEYLLVYRHSVRVEPSAIRTLLEDSLNVVDVFHLRPRDGF
ncbi:MAG: hypothetical protein AB1801_10860 [Chloroflexota bacterium]